MGGGECYNEKNRSSRRCSMRLMDGLERVMEIRPTCIRQAHVTVPKGDKRLFIGKFCYIKSL